MHSRRNATWGRLISHMAVESSCSCYQSLHTLLQPVHTNSIQKVVDSASVRAGNWGSCLLSLDSHHRRFCQTPPTSLPPAPSLPPPVLKLIPQTATMASITYENVALAGVVLFLAYSTVLITYRLFFHPLRHFPGSKICAATLWYDFYYDCVKRGTLIWQIEKLHEKYGKVAAPSTCLRKAGFNSMNPVSDSNTFSFYQAPSSASAPTSYTSKTANSTMRSTHQARAGATNGAGG
jgi:hypothetical protein